MKEFKKQQKKATLNDFGNIRKNIVRLFGSEGAGAQGISNSL